MGKSKTDLTCTSLQEIIQFNQRHASQTLRYGQPMLLLAQNERSGTLTEPQYLEALGNRDNPTTNPHAGLHPERQPSLGKERSFGVATAGIPEDPLLDPHVVCSLNLGTHLWGPVEGLTQSEVL